MGSEHRMPQGVGDTGSSQTRACLRYKPGNQIFEPWKGRLVFRVQVRLGVP